MRKFFMKAAALILSCSLAVIGGCGSKDSSKSANSTDKWDEISQTEITAEMGLGWNLGNQLEASSSGIPSETAWGNPTITKELIDTVKEQGFKTVRIPVSYLDKIGTEPEYVIDSEWLDRVQEVVDYVIDNDMYAIINMHGDGYYTIDKAWLLCVESEEQQKIIKDKYAKAWTQIAERFESYDEHLIFESMNEEFNNNYGQPDSYGYQNINAYNQIFVDTVRKTGENNSKRWLLLPGWNTNIDYTTVENGFVIPTDDNCKSDEKRIMISVHFYDPFNFTLDENDSTAKTQWGKYAYENFDSWGQEDHVDKQMEALNERFVSQGYPVIIGEMGVQDKTYLSDSFPEFRRYWYEYVISAAKKNGCICVYWDNGWNGDRGFGLFNRETLEVTQPALITAMMKAINSEPGYEIEAPQNV